MSAAGEALASTASITATRPIRRLGFNTRVSFPAGAAERGLREGVELFVAAEQLGYQSGWAYQRHFDNYLSSPLPFFAAVAQHTETISLGSAVIPMRYQEPILLAEAAATADLLSGGRLRLAVSSGTNTWDAVFGAVGTDARTEGQRRLARFLAALAGDVLHTVTEESPAGPAMGSQLRATPHSPGLRERIHYGSGHVASAVGAAAQRLRLITGTILHDVTDETFAEYQARLIAEYRAAWPGSGAAPPVAISASVLPGTSAELRARYAAYDLERRTQGPAASRPTGALDPGTRSALPSGFLMSPVFHGAPDEVAAAVAADAGIAAADELVLFLPPAFTLAENIRLLTDVAATVAPALGWVPGPVAEPEEN
jgi:alkanesulfonate monooxygenase SsuD/methylene tetrahydromethanopterin reductase-like flavin-dependent oxidoreductase (luciferase family)